MENTRYQPSTEAKELHAKHLAQSWTDQQASSDAFDSNLLTFSSAALGLSLAFIKDIVPLESAEWLKTLYVSWAAFSGCIAVTISSYQIAPQAARAHTTVLDDYYLCGIESALTRKSIWEKALPWCTGVASFCLLLGMVSTVLFAAKNLNHYKETKAWQMIKAKK